MKKAIKVTTPEGCCEHFTGAEIHISSHGVLCIKRGHRYIKAFKDGKWETAEEVIV